MFENEVFWKDGFTGKAKGGVFFRSFDLNKFLIKIESEDQEFFCIRFDCNNLEVVLNDEPRMEV